MLKTTRALAQSIQQRIGWGRIGVAAISLLIVGIAAVTLFRSLRDIEFDQVIAALHATSTHKLLIAGVFVAASYGMLTFYDFIALRTIGQKQVPYRTAALAGFTSYTIGHNIGAMVLTGGLIRLRIYSGWGLGIVDIAKIAFVTGLAFWLGNGFILGCSLAFGPAAASAISHLPAWANRAIGLSALAAIVGYLIWLLPRPRVFGRSRWQIVLPDWRSTALLIGIGVLDLCLGTLAMFVLLPSSPTIDFLTLLVIFVVAMLLGFLSHAPGSLGVIEAAMLVGLRQFQKEELLASLLIFRALYFVLPLFIGGLILAMHELWSMMQPAMGRVASKTGSSAASPAIGLKKAAAPASSRCNRRTTN